MSTTNKKAIAAQLKPTIFRLTNVVIDPKTDQDTQNVAKDCIVELMAVISKLEFDTENANA
jgi:hypothetical protein